MALPQGFRYYLPLGEVGIVFFQFRVGQNIIPKAFGTVFSPKDKMKPEKYPDGLPRG